MDVPSMIKINELAKELMDKGIATSSEEASKMAQQFLQKDVLPEASKKTDDYDKYEILLERVQRKLNNELGSLKEQLSSLINELNFLKADIKKIKLAKEAAPRVMEEIKKPKPLEEKQSTLEVKEKKKESDQRTGNLKPGDVNIEDYFYYGKKG